MIVLTKPKNDFVNVWFSEFKFDISDATITDNLTEYLDSKDPLKISFLQHSSINFDTELSIIDRVSKNVFYFIDHPHWIQHYNLEGFRNIHWVIPGEFKNRNGVNSIFWNHWIKNIANIYSNDIRFVDKLTSLYPFAPKEKYFDCLLGNARNHRDMIANLLYKENIIDKIIFTYKGNKKNPNEWKENELIESGIGYEATYFGIPIPSYDVVLINLYNQSCYTIVNETVSDNNILLITEKTAKPIIGKRLFVAFTGAGYLEKLQNIGFQTFDSIIDETYDKIDDQKTRFLAALEQVKYLCSMPQTEILEKIRPIVEHNFRHLLETDWDQITFNNINKFLQ